MQCKKPFRNKQGDYCPCGKCLPCRVRLRDDWSTRLLLESYFDPRPQIWLTLTYNDRNLPPDNSLTYDDISSFLKRLRYYSKNLRFFCAGEYGTTSTLRPHYHLYIAGYSCPAVKIYENKINQLNRYGLEEKVLMQCWRNYGDIQIENVSDKLLNYQCKHIAKDIKKLREVEDGRAPHFHRQSSGIGKNALPVLIEWLYSKEGSKYLNETGDVPNTVRCGKSIRQMPKYLKNKLRKEFGLEEKMPDHKRIEMQMQHLDNVIIYGYDYKRKQAIKHEALCRHFLTRSLKKVRL
jgi:hypothetical protein